MHVAPTFFEEYLRRTGARSFVQSRAIRHHGPIARDLIEVLIDFLDLDANGSLNLPVGFFPTFGRASVDKGNRLMKIKAAENFGGRDPGGSLIRASFARFVS
jgi:hypothetical protein